jgi:anti-sigma factor RsiW
VSCDPERVTAYVDRELPRRLERVLERHLAACPACAAQAVFEIELAASLRAPTPPCLDESFATGLVVAVFSQAASSGY